MNATSQMNLVNTEILLPQTGPYTVFNSYGGIFYIKIEPSSNPDCSWEGYSQSENCNFLYETVNAVWYHYIGW
jgi:hypothetical protein